MKLRLALRSLALLVLCCFAGTACQSQSEPLTYWTNFEWVPANEGILALADSVFIPYKPDYEAVIRGDGTYLYIRNVDATSTFVGGTYIYRLDTDNGGRSSSTLVYNNDGYFLYGNSYRNSERRWIIRVGRAAGEAGLEGDCIGFDGKVLFVKNPKPGVQRLPSLPRENLPEIYGYDLLPRDDALVVECNVFPPQ